MTTITEANVEAVAMSDHLRRIPEPKGERLMLA